MYKQSGCDHIRGILLGGLLCTRLPSQPMLNCIKIALSDVSFIPFQSRKTPPPPMALDTDASLPAMTFILSDS